MEIKIGLERVYNIGNYENMRVEAAVTVDCQENEAEQLHNDWLHRLEIWADNYMAARPSTDRTQQRSGTPPARAYLSDDELKEALLEQVAELNRGGNPDAWHRAVERVCGQRKQIDDMTSLEKAKLRKYVGKILEG